MATDLQTCPLCASPQQAFWGETSGQITLHDRWHRCFDCGVLFANPVKTSEEVAAFYRDQFYDINQLETDPSAMLPLYSWLAELSLGFKPDLQDVLEIGCGRGGFLSYLSQQTKLRSASGVEFDKRVTDRIQLPCTQKFYNDYFERLNFPQKFDAIFAWHVIEHVFDVNAFVKKIHDDLQPGGIVVIGTPAFGWFHGLKARLQRFLGRRVTVGTSSDHTYFFSSPILSQIFRRNGFEVLHQRVYLDNINGELDFKQHALKASILTLISWIMKISRLPLFGKQILIAQKAVRV
jgi:SAM-dependent methyltransferase